VGYVRCCGSSHGWLASEYDDTIREIGCHDEIMLDDKRGSFGVQDIPMKYD
jgi:hypothetical protein